MTAAAAAWARIKGQTTTGAFNELESNKHTLRVLVGCYPDGGCLRPGRAGQESSCTVGCSGSRDGKQPA